MLLQATDSLSDFSGIFNRSFQHWEKLYIAKLHNKVQWQPTVSVSNFSGIFNCSSLQWGQFIRYKIAQQSAVTAHLFTEWVLWQIQQFIPMMERIYTLQNCTTKCCGSLTDFSGKLNCVILTVGIIYTLQNCTTKCITNSLFQEMTSLANSTVHPYIRENLHAIKLHYKELWQLIHWVRDGSQIRPQLWPHNLRPATA